MNQDLLQQVEKKFQEEFKTEYTRVVAPGRINVIGEHTDYNLGFVLPAAVQKAIYMAIAPSDDEDLCQVVALDKAEKHVFKLSELKPIQPNNWQNYVMGVASEMLAHGGQVKGFNLVFAGDIPQGSGMSSSAALECGTCFGLNTIFNLQFDSIEMIKMSQAAEHHYAGVMCGIMDQFASTMGLQGQVLLLDCQSLDYRHFNCNLPGVDLVLLNSNVHHNLADSAYNKRREECETGVTVLQSIQPNIGSLRDADLSLLNQVKDQMSDTVYRRCKYVIEENMRVQQMALALESGDVNVVGDILKKAQKGMESEYEITCPEIDFLAQFANNYSGVLGSRMMGGGFGGCTINLVKSTELDKFTSEITQAYKDQFQIDLTKIPIQLSQGVYSF